jgi:NAD(P)-dependent dehydrogenase (short-subunit alcohol dehydrogenase family)
MIVTGAGSGIGAAVARRLAGAEANLVLVGRRREALETTAAGLPNAIVHPADVTDPAQVLGLVARAIAEFGQLDGLINSAGIFRMVPFADTDEAVWDQTLNVNLRSVYLVCRAAWPHLVVSQGQIVNISSIAAVHGYPGSAAYCASKFGLNGLTEVLALEGKPHGIRAVAVCPAQTETPIWDGQAPDSVRARMMMPEAVADLVHWLLHAPRNIELGPVIVRNFHNPWEGG